MGSLSRVNQDNACDLTIQDSFGVVVISYGCAQCNLSDSRVEMWPITEVHLGWR